MGSSCKCAAKHPWPRARSDTGRQPVCGPDLPERGGAGEPCGRGRAGAEGRGSLSVPVCGVGLRPEVLKCMSAAAGSGPVRAAATAAAVVLKRTAPECLAAAAAATMTRKRRGPAAPAREHLGRGGGGAGSRIAGPRSWPPRGWARSPPPEPARLHSGRRLLPHPFQHVVYPVILDHHCAGRKRVSRAVSGGGGENGALVPASRSATARGPETPLGPPCYSDLPVQTLLPTQPTADPSSHRPTPLLVEERPSSKDSSRSTFQSKPSRRLSSPPSELIGKLLLMGSPSSTLTSTEFPPHTESPSIPALYPT